METHAVLIWGTKLSDALYFNLDSAQGSVKAHDCIIEVQWPLTGKSRIVGVLASRSSTPEILRLGEQCVLALPSWRDKLKSALASLGIENFEQPAWHLVMEYVEC